MQLYSTTTPSALDWTAYLAGKDPAWKGQASGGGSGSSSRQGRGLLPLSRLLWYERSEAKPEGIPMGCAVCCWRGRVVGHLSGVSGASHLRVWFGPHPPGWNTSCILSLSPSKTTIRTLTVTLRPIRFLGSVTRDDNLLRMSATCGGVEQAIPHAPPQTSTAPNKPWGLEEGRKGGDVKHQTRAAGGDSERPRCLHHILVLFNLARRVVIRTDTRARFV
jgi:hypothetical protein